MKWSILRYLGIFLVLVMALAHPAGAASELIGPYWRAVEINSSPVAGEQSKREPHLVFSEEGRVSGSAGCNRFTGTYKQDGHNLQFSPLAVTKMACPPPLDSQERVFLQAMAATASVRASGKTLELLDAGGNVKMRLQGR